MSLFSNNLESPSESQENSENKDVEITIETADAEISLIMQEVYSMGANDHELGTLKKIQEDLRSGKISPKESVEKAASVRENKQDYH
ncbi:MAG: hypothetical protein KBC11_00010 [Candidatus Pacebacteria bacterium]|nr:hypothetical protein [Candidatus Paceibacterota bacterium]